jgi:HlyD family secretion protein
VDEGSEVKRGELIALLDSYPQMLAETSAALAQVRTAQSRLDLALAGTDPRRIESIEAELAEAKLAADLDKREAQRYGELAKRQTVSTADLEDRQSRYQRALMTVKRLSATLEEARTVRPEDIAVARAQLSEAEASLATAKARLALTEIRSPIDGTILKIHARAGERVGDKGLAEIGDVTRMAAVAEIYEADMPRIRAGAPATVRLKTTDLNLRGTVRELGRMVGRKVALDNDPVSDTDARVVEVRIELDSESSAQVTGLSNARVDVVVSGDQKQ